MFKFTFVPILFILATLSTLAFTFPIQPGDFNKFKEDLGVLSSGIYSLSFAVNSIGNTVTPQQALAIYGQGDQVRREIDTCNGDARGIHSVSSANAKDVLNVAKGFTPTIVETLYTIGKKKHVLERYSSLVRKQLEAIQRSSITLGNILIKLAPSDSKGEAISLKNQINAAFNKAIKIYS
ncbi:hypothetical protein APHAL10511_006825 [Amanita phalloides]|nr:hypothetical protein APHAL10511_006825 [Amanita phalloides]